VTAPIRVLIADDHSIVRDGLKLILETADDLEVAGEAADGAEAVRLAEELKPDVVLMDLRMPGMDGLTALEQLRDRRATAAVVILTTYNEDDLMRRGLRAGARGYLLKDTDRQTLLNTIRAAARGETLLKPEVLARLLAQAGPPSAPAKPETALRSQNAREGLPELSDREQEVLEGIALGERSKEIAARLGITERTVKAHLASIYNKLGVSGGRIEALNRARELGYLKAR
jgi:NarL family two-component system response regulator YdfI